MDPFPCQTKRLYFPLCLWLVFLVLCVGESQTLVIKLSTRHSSQTVKVGVSVTLICTWAGQSGRTTYEWQHNEKAIRRKLEPRIMVRDNAKLKILKTELGDSGIYTCTGTRKGKTVRQSRSVLLTVEGMCSTARIVTHPSQEKKFPVGTDLTLRCQCRSSGTGMATTWMNNGITVTPEDGRIFLDRSKLIIYNASFADSGNYTCNVTVDKLGTAKSQKLDIWVGNKPQIVVHPPNRIAAVKGQTIAMDCLATGVPHPSVIWSYVGPILYRFAKRYRLSNDSTYTIYNNGTLVIRNLDTRDMVFYECEATNVIGTVEKPFRIYGPIKLTTKPIDTIAVVGKTVILRCSASGTPKPKISWANELGRLDLESEKRFRQYSNGNLQIREVSIADEGKYFCVASADDEYEEVTATLSVIESDAIKVSRLHKHNARAFLGLKTHIKCKFHGRPPITVTWTKRGLDKLPSRAEYYGASLFINDVITSDAGQYFCNASNEFGSRVTYINLSVYDPVLFLPSNITAFVGDSIWLHCAARGSPTPRITWFKSGQGGKPLDKERFILHENGSMIIRDVQLMDKGTYFCLTSANIKQSSTRYLEVTEKPIQNDEAPDIDEITDSARRIDLGRIAEIINVLTIIHILFP